MKNVLADIPYADGQAGKRKLIDEKHLFVMQVALKPGQQVPQHNSSRQEADPESRLRLFYFLPKSFLRFHYSFSPYLLLFKSIITG